MTNNVTNPSSLDPDLSSNGNSSSGWVYSKSAELCFGERRKLNLAVLGDNLETMGLLPKDDCWRQTMGS